MVPARVRKSARRRGVSSWTRRSRATRSTAARWLVLGFSQGGDEGVLPRPALRSRSATPASWRCRAGRPEPVDRAHPVERGALGAPASACSSMAAKDPRALWVGAQESRQRLLGRGGGDVHLPREPDAGSRSSPPRCASPWSGWKRREGSSRSGWRLEAHGALRSGSPGRVARLRQHGRAESYAGRRRPPRGTATRSSTRSSGRSGRSRSCCSSRRSGRRSRPSSTRSPRPAATRTSGSRSSPRRARASIWRTPGFPAEEVQTRTGDRRHAARSAPRGERAGVRAAAPAGPRTRR